MLQQEEMSRDGRPGPCPPGLRDTRTEMGGRGVDEGSSQGDMDSKGKGCGMEQVACGHSGSNSHSSGSQQAHTSYRHTLLLTCPPLKRIGRPHTLTHAFPHTGVHACRHTHSCTTHVHTLEWAGIHGETCKSTGTHTSYVSMHRHVHTLKWAHTAAHVQTQTQLMQTQMHAHTFSHIGQISRSLRWHWMGICFRLASPRPQGSSMVGGRGAGPLDKPKKRRQHVFPDCSKHTLRIQNLSNYLGQGWPPALCGDEPLLLFLPVLQCDRGEGVKTPGCAFKNGGGFYS